MFIAKGHFVGTQENFKFLLHRKKQQTYQPTKKLQPLKAKNTSKGSVEDTERYYHILQRFKMDSVFFCQWNTHENL